MLSTWLLWGLILAIPVAPVVYRLFADEHPRNDEPPDTRSSERLIDDRYDAAGAW